MLEGLAPDLAPRLIIAIGGVALAFVVLILVLVFLKRKNAPLFIKGGRAREHRLVVLDAAAVDAKRRLVLIRRDETEHLIMIGGPTDIVIETCINVQRQAEVLPADREQRTDSRLVADARAALALVPKEEPSRPASSEPNTADVAREQAERRAERQARRQERLEAEAKSAAVKNISAAGAALYGEDREPAIRETPREVPRAAEVAPAARQAQVPIARETEDLLEEARSRVLPVEPQQAPAEKAAAEEAAVKAMTERLEAARAEALRIEAEKIEAAKAEAQRAEAERAEAEKAEAARLEAQRAEAARIQAEQEEAARLAAQREEAERLYAQQMAARRLEAERLERERAEARRLESARLRAEAERRAQAEEAERRALADEAAKRAEAERQQAEAERQQAERQFTETENRRVEPVMNAAYAEHLTDEARESLATDFEKLLEVELQKGGILDDGTAPVVEAEPRDAASHPGVYPIRREPTQVVTGATPGHSAEQDMARRLGEISLNKKSDSA